ncbi:MAG TPA: class I SAM-dependent methyltransferase [Acidimicrobiia bacterium]|jgi:2-polyprenyl-3-methyl-5-hydroxy-6-metoxy-1,4-benzoquinol methylase|nr:class I SAM-dependent methyltransferase [Acidimicrobiia bacterium]
MTHYDSDRYARINRWDSSHLKRVNRHVTIGPETRVLEVGCGQGHLTKALASQGAAIVGIDANPRAPEVAGTDLVRCMSAESLDFADESFDVVVSVHAIEHIPPLREALAEMARVLVPGGKAVFVYPAEPIMGLYAIPTSIILHGTPFKARQVHCHKLWPAKVRRMFEPLGMTEVHSEFSLLKSPQFTSVFEKTG